MNRSRLAGPSRTGRALGASTWLLAAMLIAPTSLIGPIEATGQQAVSVRAALSDADEDYVPDRSGEIVEVEGVLTTHPAVIGRNVAVVNLQDRTGGILLFSRDTTALRGLARGDSVRVAGEISQYRGAEQLVVQRLERLGSGTLPPPRDVLAAGLNGERYSGQLVRVTGVLRVIQGPSGRLDAELSDRSGAISVYLSSRSLSDPDLVEAVRRGGEVEVVGIASQRTDEAPFDTAYELIPREPEDFSFAPVPPYRELALLMGFLGLLATVGLFWIRRRAAERRAREMADLAGSLKAAKAELERERAYLRAVIEATPDGVFVKDQEGRFTVASRAMADFYGVSPEEMVGLDEGELGVSASQLEEFLAADRAVLETGLSTGTGLVRVPHPRDGRERWFETRKVALEVPGGERHVLGVAIDVTERRGAEERLRRQSAAMDAASDGMAVLDQEGRFIYVNRAQAEIYGYPAESLLGMSWVELYTGEELRRMETQVLPVVSKSGRWVGEAVGTRRDGSTFPQELSLTAIENGGIICVVRDSTARKQLEEQLRQAQKLESLGRLAGGIAHDFNNLLQVIKGNATLALDVEPVAELVREELEEIGQASGRAEELVQQLLAFSRKQSVHATVVDMNEVVRGTDRMLRRLIGTDVELVTLLDGELGAVQADASQLEQVLFNLAVNARDAMPDGGVLAIETRNVRLSSEPQRNEPRAGLDFHVLVEVRDTGVGIDAATLEKIFDPFFTTKERGKGTGLGLSIVHGIVEQAGGFVEVESRVGIGTEFRIYLPRVAERAPPPTTDQQAVRTASTASDATVLVVDDEGMVRRTITRVLERSGFRVLAAANGEEALRVVAEHGGEIDLLLTDVVMPLMGGRELAERVRALRPRMPIIFMSGYNEESLQTRLANGRSAFISKPCDAGLLVQEVQQVLTRTE